jgi:putative xylitol transport system permease protein
VQRPATPSSPARLGGARLKRLAARYGIVLAFFVLCALLSFANEFFLTWGNWTNVLRQTSINGILAIGMTYVILSGGIDLSVGSMLALCGMVAGSLVTGVGAHHPLVAIAAGIGTGLGLGTVNGLLVARLAVPPFVATLGMLSAARGLTFIYSDGMPIPNLSPGFRFIGQGDLLGVPMPIWLLLAVFAIFFFILSSTTYGRYVYAVGGSEKSAKTSGISTRSITFSVYVICGGLAGLAGMILAARTTSALPQAGISYELDAIAAVVIGGTSLSMGGVGSLVGTLFGALIIGVINNGLDLMGVSSYYQQLIKGIIIVAAVLLDSFTRKRKA